MRIVVKPRGGGKTHYLLKKVAQNPNSIMITPTEQQAILYRQILSHSYYVEKEAAKKRIICFKKAIENGIPFNMEVYLDELDTFLWNIFGTGVTETTCTGDVDVSTEVWK